MKRMFIFGLGYSAKRIAAALESAGWVIESTGSDGTVPFDDRLNVQAALKRCSHVLSSVPPDRGSGADPVLQTYGNVLSHGWTGYLSSTGVYGDTEGAWVDESTPIGGGRRSARAECDALWLGRGARVFRLPGIYGPDRSAFDRVRSGKAHRIDIPGQVFSRVHVEDIASGVVAGINGPAGAYNLGDDLPCSQNAVIEEACRLLGAEIPPLLTIEDADLSPMARGFYAENRRVANGKAKRVLQWEPQFPDFRSGLRSLL
ncbi:SDR family NAD(P)-dependent oxidoreductase [Altererythrobacter sp.]|nr:SDR family NAD(P)-dependent oxidoreductase [Altererythrobacter sp.]